MHVTLGAALGLDSAGATALVDRLGRAGHGRRVRGERDRRRIVIEVEERAVELGRSFFGPLIEHSVERLRGYDARERSAIRGCTGGVREAAVAEKDSSRHESGHRNTR